MGVSWPLKPLRQVAVAVALEIILGASFIVLSPLLARAAKTLRSSAFGLLSNCKGA